MLFRSGRIEQRTSNPCAGGSNPPRCAKIKVKPLTAGIEYDANGGTIEGKETFKDKRKELNNGWGFGRVDVDITSKLPTKDGYRFAFWYEPSSYSSDKKVYSVQDIDQKVYPVGKDNVSNQYEGIFLSYNGSVNETKYLKAVWDKEYELNFDVNGGDDELPKKSGTSWHQP